MKAKYGDLSVVGFRNIFRNRRRTILNVIAITLGMALMTLGLGWVQGYGTYIYQALIDFETGQLQVLREDYLDEQARLPLDVTIQDYQRTRKTLLARDEVSAASGRIDFSLNLSKGSRSVRLMGRGIDPEAEANVTVIRDFVQEGSYLTGEAGILLGAPLAEKLDVQVGDTLFVTALDAYSVENFLDVKLIGIFSFAYPAIDQNIVFMDLQTAGSLLSLEDEVTRVVLRLEEGVTPEKAEPEIEQLLEDEYAGEDRLAVELWKRFARTAVSGVQGDTYSFWFILVILYILILLGILNSMSMSVHERTAEIGTLRAIGIKKKQVFLLFLTEAAGIALISAGCSLLLSLPLAGYLQFVGFDIASAIPDDVPIPFGERFRADFRLWHFVLPILISTAAAVLGSIIPARRAVKLNVARAMSGRE